MSAPILGVLRVESSRASVDFGMVDQSPSWDTMAECMTDLRVVQAAPPVESPVTWPSELAEGQTARMEVRVRDPRGPGLISMWYRVTRLPADEAAPIIAGWEA